MYQQATKYCGKEEKLFLNVEKRRNFSSFPQYFQYIPNLGVKLHIHSVKGGCRLIVFLSSANLICRSTDISKCFIESLGFRDNESRLHIAAGKTAIKIFLFFFFFFFFFFLFCGTLLELPPRGAYYEYSQHFALEDKSENIYIFWFNIAYLGLWLSSIQVYIGVLT